MSLGARRCGSGREGLGGPRARKVGRACRVGRWAGGVGGGEEWGAKSPINIQRPNPKY